MRLDIPGIRIYRIRSDRAVVYCPIHKGGQEARPAAVIYFRTGTWKCHACGEGGTLVTLYSRLGLPVNDAKTLARDLKLAAPKATDPETKRPVCPEYFLGPYNHRPLNLINLGYSREILDSCGVGFDKVRMRVTYPIRSHDGSLYGVVGGAIFKEEEHEYHLFYGKAPKYLAYGPDQGFPHQVNPKWSLWNYHRVVGISDDRPLVVVEGFKALMWVAMSGYDKVVATCGAGYEDEQVHLISRLGAPVLLFLDADPTGTSATRKLRAELRRRMPGVAEVTYPRKVKQPDDLTFEEVRRCLDRG